MSRPHPPLRFAASLLAVLLCLLPGAGTGPGAGAGLGPPTEPARSVRVTERGQPGWVSPVPGARPDDVVRAFAAPLQPWGRGHRGVDLSALPGVVRAPADGVVRFVGPVVGRPVVTIAHDDGLVSSMEPVLSEIPVGSRVAAGEVIGSLEPLTPHCLLPCVHWGVRREDAWSVGAAVFDRYVDPLWLLGWSGPSVLWPHDTARRGDEMP